MSDAGITDLVRSWIDGWTVSRGAADPVAEPWGWTIDVGQARHVRRHVLPEPDEAEVRKVADGTTAPWTWLKVFAEEDTVRPWIGPGWHLDEPGHLMSRPLTPEHPAVPAGYRLTTWNRAGVTRALVRDADGRFAARGQVARAPQAVTAVVDQIETAPEHRRRGLGSLVVRTLQNAAHADGARRALLVATPDGQALYTPLGWTTHAAMTSLFYEPGIPAAE